jgi:hypothetical protein
MHTRASSPGIVRILGEECPPVPIVSLQSAYGILAVWLEIIDWGAMRYLALNK